MLQIISGKFFKTPNLTRTVHRGSFYTNYRLWARDGLQTRIASLHPTVTASGPLMLNYEIIEQLEDDRRPGSLVATTGSDLVNDFSAVVSFALNITCTPDSDLARRLVVDERPTLGVSHTPRSIVRRIFDKEIAASASDEELLKSFIEKLVALRRDHFKGAMRAIRQYVTATHRLSDNPDLAYTLFVAAMESLAQSFDGHVGTWLEYDERKRDAINSALEGVPAETISRVQAAILDNEHGALRHRFRAFVVKHTKPQFFREEAAAIAAPVVRSALTPALDAAYRLRSLYIHTLKPIPGNLSMPDDRFEITDIGDGPILTFNGLVRLSRHVILSFIDSCNPGEDPDFNYRSDLPGIVQMRMASQYWIGNANNFGAQNARRFLGAHFEEIGPLLLRTPGVSITDLGGVLAKIEQLVPGLAKPSQRVPLIALYMSYHLHLHEKHHRDGWNEFYKKYDRDLDAPTIDSLLLHLMTDNEPPWDLEVCDDLRGRYFAEKFSRKGLQAGQIVETILVLWLAEKRRIVGEIDAARSLLGFAVENFPSNAALRTFETSAAGELPPINWREILIPKQVVEEAAAQ